MTNQTAPAFKPGGGVVPVTASAKPATNEADAAAAQALIDQHADVNTPAAANQDKPRKQKGRPKTADAMTEQLHSILATKRLKQVIEALALKWDRSEAWVMRKLMTEAGENHIIKEDLQHELDH